MCVCVCAPIIIIIILSSCKTLSRYSFLSPIAPGRSSRPHPVSVQSCCRWVLVGHPTFALTCERVHQRTSLMNSFLFLQQYPASIVHLICMVVVMGGRWLYSCCFVGCCFQDLFNMTRTSLVQSPISFFSIHFVSIHVVHPNAARKNWVLLYQISLTITYIYIYILLQMPEITRI